MPGYQVSDSESPKNRHSPSSDSKSVAIMPPVPGSADSSSRSSRSTLSAEDLKHNGSYKRRDEDVIEAIEAPPEQEVVVKTGDREEIEKVSLFKMFRYADGLDIFLIIFGIIMAIALGCCVPINLLVYGEVIQNFIQYTVEVANATAYNSTAPIKSCYDRVHPNALLFLIIAGVALVSGFLGLLCWTITAQRQTHRIRAKFFAAVLNQHIGWYDANQAGQTTSRLAEDVMNIENGIGDKLGSLIMWTSTFFAGYIIGFISGWKLTLIMLSLMPIMIASAAVMGIMVRKLTTTELTAYAVAGAVAEEVLGAIRTVTAFGAQERETVRYSQNLDGARKVAVKRGLVTGVGMGLMFGVIYPAFGLAFWYAITQMSDGSNFNAGNTMKVTMGVMLGSMSIGYAAPNMQTLAIAQGAAASVFKIIDLVSEIDPSSPDGKKPAKCSGDVQFTDVTFRYPQRKEVQILKGVSFEARVGQTLALVGASGCGKSTIVSLVQRFYDTESGTVKIDGVDVRELNVKWLRQQIGIVSQEPVLFNETIANNIRYGHHEATQEMIEKAAKEANAHDFIMRLPDKYNTPVGERGTQLSGGQKQRIAIARGILRDPKILLLDEATSALDSTNEAIVQAALDKARMGRTTIVIAHRLSTIRNADIILVMDQGKVVESGTHSQLLAKNGFYTNLHNAQAHSKMPEAVEEEEEEEEVLEGGDRGLVRRSSTRSSIRSENNVQLERKTVWTAKDEEEATKKLPPASIFRIMSMNKPEVGYIIVGCICVFISGGLMPCFSIIFSGAINNFANLDRDGQLYQAGLYAVWFALIGVGIAVLTIFQQYCLTVAGEQLTVRLRERVFHAMLYQEMTYYDEPANGVGNLTARLATDAAAVKGASGTQLGVALNAVSTIVLATILALIFGWKLALVVLGFVPFLLLMGWMQRMMLVGLSVANRDVIEQGGKIASEAVTNIRTVAALGLEETFVNRYTRHFSASTNTRRQVVSCFMFGLSQSVIYFVYTATFIFGAWLIDRREMDFLNVLRVFSTVTFSAMSLGRAIAFAPDYTKGRLSAAKMFALLDREPAIDVRSTKGKILDSQSNADVEFQETCFTYPMRPGVKVLRGLNVTIKPGQTIALVGQSGCGKSTTVQLLERFYDVTGGIVKVDGCDVREVQLQSLRRLISLVSQEPTLFNMTIRENIVYGLSKQEVPDDVIISVAKQANIHNFVSALPQGYDTIVGEKATQLSGGQKQRIAIARALIRDPKILLLDEATSALDSESELIVQEALDAARQGRTSIVIAHRLSTIQSADQIIVIEDGRAVEAGKHSELLALKGKYYALYQAQQGQAAKS